MQTQQIVILGSANLDIVNRVAHIPHPGETIISSGMMRNPGGKGANQAVAAGKLGGNVHFIGCVGNDDAGSILLSSLASAGVCTDAVKQVPQPTGTAYINVSDDGENCIIVLPGANDTVDSSMLDRQDALLRDAAVLVAQLEIPAQTVWEAVRRGHRYGATVILNPSPVQQIPEDVLRQVDILIPNEKEMAALLGGPLVIGDPLCDYVKNTGVGCIVLTLGEAGCCIVREDGFTTLPCQRMDPVDTTGAGDTFLGALTVALSEGKPLEQAAEFAMRASAYTILHTGAQQAMPTRSDLIKNV